MVSRARDYITAGDIIQVAPSQRFEAPVEVHMVLLTRGAEDTILSNDRIFSKNLRRIADAAD
jgi:hypothetical protein